MTALIPRRVRSLASLAEALLTPHGMDRYLELVDPMLVRREIRGLVTAVRKQTPGTVTLTVRPSRAWPGFTAGQYVRLQVEIDGVRRTRCYSPCGSQYDGELEFTVKEQGLVSGHLNRALGAGSVVGLSIPDGTFTLPATRPDRVLLVSGGSGVTPVLAMARTLVDEGHTGEIVFLHYSNGPADALYRTELAELAARHPGLRVVHAYTHTGGGDLRGFFSPEHLERVAPWYRDAEAFVCGPKPLMDAVREQLGERVHTEEFTPPALTFDTANAEGQVRFKRSGRECANSGKPLLEQAEEAGLSPEHGCRMGICFSCTQLKTAGRVRNAKTGEISGEEDEEIQLCISVPVGDVEIDA
ncbi:Flavodoxin reductases (ferredoxin-NADPH reductases) family 1 [Amycolatopsis camponoti]|uniref:Flavodoxin reductases (Ferredoxin-NADPH reductases) family 1 n=1 Tax=Amycolatopsis camponoti TaxID=2606593 RepID=A0A6I8LXI9_9PSEU|nr:ferredoxin reductase [Amycolatopsis camponoti]VVJ20295.1 Flavodoxin reductases (ferredoxin-NADPH reductases) family 1 [Amycolatopsis camponoti]